MKLSAFHVLTVLLTISATSFVTMSEGITDGRGQFDIRTDRLEEQKSEGRGPRVDPSIFHPELTEQVKEAKQKEQNKKEENFASLFEEPFTGNTNAYSSEKLFSESDFSETSFTGSVQREDPVSEAGISWIWMTLIAASLMLGAILSFKVKKV